MLFGSCKPDEKISFDENLVDIYVAGSEDGKPLYWKNGVAVPLNFTQVRNGINVSAKATKILVLDGDVYAIGSENPSQYPFYWKNSQQIFLTEFGYTNNIAISSGDIYITGNNSKPVYWKNGNLNKLPGLYQDPYNFGYALGITFDGTDTYISGELLGKDASTKTTPVVWKNGVITQLLYPVSLNPSIWYDNAVVTSVKISGTDVHACGFITRWQQGASVGNYIGNNIAVYWKNGQPTLLGTETDFSYALNMILVGGDVYIVGIEVRSDKTHVGIYWKNNQPVLLDEKANVDLYDISVQGNDIYLAGSLDTAASGAKPLPVACYWVNGSRVQCGLGVKSSLAYSMQVVAR